MRSKKIFSLGIISTSRVLFHKRSVIICSAGGNKRKLASCTNADSPCSRETNLALISFRATAAGDEYVVAVFWRASENGTFRSASLEMHFRHRVNAQNAPDCRCAPRTPPRSRRPTERVCAQVQCDTRRAMFTAFALVCSAFTKCHFPLFGRLWTAVPPRRRAINCDDNCTRAQASRNGNPPALAHSSANASRSYGQLILKVVASRDIRSAAFRTYATTLIIRVSTLRIVRAEQ